MNENCDKIIIQIPKKADYVGLVRLTASGVASKIGFDIDAIEDIKVAVSEICNKIISYRQDAFNEDYIITFQLLKGGFKAYFRVNDHLARTMFEGEAGGTGNSHNIFSDG